VRRDFGHRPDSTAEDHGARDPDNDFPGDHNNPTDVGHHDHESPHPDGDHEEDNDPPPHDHPPTAGLALRRDPGTVLADS
jgi:hypothetical protein